MADPGSSNPFLPTGTPWENSGAMDSSERNFDAGAQSSGPQAPPSAQPGGDTPAAPPRTHPMPSAASASTTADPTVVTPKRRGGLAGLIDEFRDAVAGKQGPGQVYTDADGNEYIRHPDMTSGQKWLKIVGGAIRGAAAGASVGQGPGGPQRALAAGIGSADKIQENQQKAEKSMSEEVRLNNAERLSAIKLKHDVAANEFDLGRRKVKAQQEDVEFAQKQIDRELKLVSDGRAADLGVFADEKDLTRVQQQVPDFWKKVYGENSIMPVPEYDMKGNRRGIHLFMHIPTEGAQMEAPGTPIHVIEYSDKGEPVIKEQIPSGPITRAQKEAYDYAAFSKRQKWIADQEELKLKGSETERNESEVPKNKAEANRANAEADKARQKASGVSGYVERQDGTVWIGTKGEAEQAGLPFEEMKTGDINRDKQAMRQLNDVQMNASRYTKAAEVYANANSPLTYRGKPVNPTQPIYHQGPLSIFGKDRKITTQDELRADDNRNLNILMNKAGYAELNASLSGGNGHIELPVVTAFGEALSREISSKSYNELSDQAKDLYDGYLRTLSAIPAYVKVLTNIGRSNKEILNLELANIKHPGYAPADILRGQAAFQQNIDKAADGFPRNMVGVAHPSDTRRHLENNGGELPDDVKRLLNNNQTPQ